MSPPSYSNNTFLPQTTHSYLLYLAQVQGRICPDEAVGRQLVKPLCDQPSGEPTEIGKGKMGKKQRFGSISF